MDNLLRIFSFLFSTDSFEPHGVHFSNYPYLMWAMVGANIVTFISYTIIPLAIMYFIWKRKDLIFTKIFWLFGAFIVLCGLHHLVHVITFWYPIFYIQLIVDVATAVVSMGTFFVLLSVLPKAIQLQMPKELEEINKKLAEEVKGRKVAEEALQQRANDLKTQNEEMQKTKAAMLNLMEDLQTEKAKDEAILENIGEGVVATDKEGVIIAINNNAKKLLGIKNDAVGDVFSNLCAIKNEKGKFLTAKERPLGTCLLLGEHTNTSSYRYIRRDKTTFPVAINVTPIMFDNKLIGAVEVFRDITGEIEAMEQIKEKAEELKKFQLAVEDASDQIVISDADGVVLYANHATVNITGYTIAEIIGTKAGVLWGGHMEKAFYERLWKTIKIDKKPFLSHITNRRKNGENYTAEIHITPILDEKGEPLYFVSIERDITKEMEIDKAKTEFVALASHQLRTPLSAIKWYSKMLLQEDRGKITEKQKEYLEEIHEGNEKMVALVNSLLNVSRLELGTFAIQPKKVQIISICEEVLEDVKKDVIAKKLEIVKKFEDIPQIIADPNYLRIILQNLLTNAIKYTSAHGTITISISQEHKNILITVTDTGYGIPEKDKDKIFTKLFRADNAVTKNTDGTGLGLYITKAVVEKAAKGKIWFESVENKGTTFFVLLPQEGMEMRKGVKKLT